jgi:hypothetical protein
MKGTGYFHTPVRTGSRSKRDRTPDLLMAVTSCP